MSTTEAQIPATSKPARRTRRRLAAILASLSAPLAATSALAAACTLQKLAEFPVTMMGMRPLMSAKINGTDVQLIVDSGAFYSMLSESGAARLKLRTSAPPPELHVVGANGAATVSVVTVRTFALSGAALHNVQFLVDGNELGRGAVGLLGQNFLDIADVEYDLGEGMVRLMKPEDCSKALLAYWVKASMPYSVVDMEPESSPNVPTTGSRIRAKPSHVSHTIALVYVNGVEMRAVFDTGSATSMLSEKAAARAGIKPDSPGVVSAGSSYGIGRQFFATYLVPVSSFKIGDEEIRNTRMRMADIDVPGADVLIGADFFLSHRIYVANGRQKLYFTYSGGPVFNLSSGNRSVSAAAEASPHEAGGSAAAAGNAADFGRLGAAFAARRQFDQALAALTRACELAPDDPRYWYLRGAVYAQLKRPDAAEADFDRAVKLEPDDLPVLIARAQLSLARGDEAAAAADLDAADAVAPKEADVRLQMAIAYQDADRLAPAVAQLTLWIDSHPDDARVPLALDSRCRIRALEDADLPLALQDCTSALKMTGDSSHRYGNIAGSRGLVYLRMRQYDKSIADYDTSLSIDPKAAWSLYGRGIDELRKQQTATGSADIARATALSPRIAAQFGRAGIMP